MQNQPDSTPLQPFHWRTAISWKSVDKITVRGFDINELARGVSFVDSVYLVFCGNLPTPAQERMLSHIMVAFIEHSFSPSTVTARMCAAGRPPINAAIAAGILTFGDAHGPGMVFSELLTGLLQDARKRGVPLEQAADEFVADRLARRLKIYGVHQPQHTDGDPRAGAVVARAHELGVAGPHTELQAHIQESLKRRKKQHLAQNLLGAAGPVLLDLGFSPAAAFSIGVLARGFGNAAHAVEELERESAWRASKRNGMADILDLSLQGRQYYDGPPDRAVPSMEEREALESELDGASENGRG